jgi:hypothetical protein
MESVMDFKSYLTGQTLLESGFARLAQIMSGLVPTVKTFAFVTWENPMKQSLSQKENEDRNNNLKRQLRSGAYGFVQIHGKYDSLENPYVIFNITEKDAIELGKLGNQESVIFGEVKAEFDIVFKLIYCFSNQVHIRKVWRSSKDDNYYSEYKGRKFQIPFFDDHYKDAKFDRGRIVQDSYNIFYRKDFTDNIINEVETMVADRYDANLVGKHHWLMRGSAFEKLKDHKRKHR